MLKNKLRISQLGQDNEREILFILKPFLISLTEYCKVSRI